MAVVTSAYRFYCPHLIEAGPVVLGDSEAHHALHVLRLQTNDVVELFDGKGLVGRCQIAAVRKRELQLDVVSTRRDPPPATHLTLATAVPKGERFDWLVEKATELGVSRLIPLVTQRSVVDPRSSKLDKQRQTVIAACKQSGRNHLMEISAVTQWSDFLIPVPEARRLYIAHPDGESISESVLREQSITVAIGPEGGFSDEEVQSAVDAGAQKIQLGRQILRIETAAIVVAAKFLC